MIYDVIASWIFAVQKFEEEKKIGGKKIGGEKICWEKKFRGKIC